MDNVLVLVGGTKETPLNDADIGYAKTSLRVYNITCGNPRWLRPDYAADITLSSAPNPDGIKNLREELRGRKIDVFLVSSEHRRKKLLLADMDATIVAGETLDDLAEIAGLKEKISAITARAMRGELDFKQALEERVAMLAGLPEGALADTYARMTVNTGADTVVRVMRAHGADCYLVSGGFTYFTEKVAARCGFTGHHGNTLGIKGSVLTGRVVPPILDKDAKLRLLRDYRDRAGLSPALTMAVGDGANDIPMLQEAGLGVGFFPKPKVADVMVNQILYTDLTSLLYIQGYTWQDMARV